MIEIKRGLQVIHEKKQAPLTVDDLLSDLVIEVAFPNIRKLLLISLLVLQSEAVVERGFSCMNMVMTDKGANLDL